MARGSLRNLGYATLIALATACSEGDKNPVDSGTGVEDVVEQSVFYDLDFTKVFKDPSFREDQLLFSDNFQGDYSEEYAKLTGGNDYSGKLKVRLRGAVPILKVAKDQGMRVPITPLEARVYQNQGVIPVGTFRDGQGSAVILEFVGPSKGTTYLGIKDLASTVTDDSGKGIGKSPRRIRVNGNYVPLDSISPGNKGESTNTVDITTYVIPGGINTLEYFAADPIEPLDEPMTDPFLNRLVISSSEPFSDAQ